MARQTYDVAVIGGGIAGCASAYYLARRGLREIPLMIECNGMWRELSRELEADLEWRQGGLVYLAENQERRDGSFNVAPRRSSELYIVPDCLRYLRDFWPNFKTLHADIELLVGRETWDGLGLMLGGQKALARQMKHHRVLDPEANAKAAGRAFAEFKKLFPAMTGLHIEISWAGMIEATPDEIPVLDAVPGYRGLYVATGFSGHGFGMGPIAGRLMAETIADAPTSHDLTAFRFNRFAAAKLSTHGDAV